jgi:alpha-galactosidase
VRNTDLITNLPQDCCVEVPVLVDRSGLRPTHMGALPPQLAATDMPHIFVQELVVRAALEGDRDAVHQAVMLDRLAPTGLSLDEMRAMADELLEAHGDAMPEGLRTSREPVAV